ncbi:MAG: DUF2589 domain-containing protein [bacterium]|nr:DUF2589 domain-containing protein [bacterium]
MSMAQALEFGSLIGAQLTALIEAEAEGAEKTAEFIESVGFDRQPDGSMKLRMVTFEMERRDTDGTSRVHRISMPIITLVPIPMLTIESATLAFDLNVEHHTIAKSASTAAASPTPTTFRERLAARSPGATPKKKPKLATRLVSKRQGRSSSRSTNDTKSNADLQVQVQIGQADFPIGIERLLNVAELSLQDETNGE